MRERRERREREEREKREREERERGERGTSPLNWSLEKRGFVLLISVLMDAGQTGPPNQASTKINSGGWRGPGWGFL